MFSFDLLLRWIWNQYYEWHIWIVNRTKMIVLPLFLFDTRLKSQNPYETEIHNIIRLINIGMNTGIANWLIWSIDIYKMRILSLFQFDTRLLTSKHRNSLVNNSWSEMELCEKRAFQLLKMRNMNISWNTKTKYVADIILCVRSSRMKDCTCH